MSHRGIWHIWGWDCDQQCLCTTQNKFGTNWFNISGSKSLDCVKHYLKTQDWILDWPIELQICEVELYLDSKRLELKGPKQKSSFSHNLTQFWLCQDRSFYKNGIIDLFYRSQKTFPISQNIIFTQSDTILVVSQVFILQKWNHK